jgi:arabinose-5-phosphate isomerase
MKEKQIIASMKEVLNAELGCLKQLLEVIDESYAKVVQAIYRCEGKLVVSGMGKSGHIAKKIVATMNSVGTKAHFLHPAEACHGDLGIISSEDIVMLISNSGETEELLNLLPSLKALNIPLIAISARKESSIVKNCHYFLWMPIKKEACSMNLVPTSSTLVSLAIGDALAITLMKMKQFQQEDFARFHPAGSLGKRLSLSVADIMLKDSNIPCIAANQKLTEIITSISEGTINATAVVDEKMNLLGLITGYNIREVFLEKKDIYNISASQIMNSNPVVFSAGAKAYDAMVFMKQGGRILNVLPIVEEKKLVGILSLQDLIRAGL